MEKKVCILTFQRAINYGATLQMYALQKVIKEQGCSVEILDYYSDFIYKNYKIFNFSDIINLKNFLQKFLNGYTTYKRNKKFKKFIAYNMVFTKKLLKNDLKSLEQNYDIFIVGSDQVWNPNITNNDESYFLDFINDNAKKYSYAASFGVSKWEQFYKLDINTLLKSFKMISVREDTAKKIIQSQLTKDISVDLDPVFLLPKNTWINLVKNRAMIDREYILVYTVGNPKYVYEYTKKLSEQNNCDVINIRYKISLKNKNFTIGNVLYDVGPDEFVSLIANAKYIVTNSFHATAFSIIFNKKIYIELPDGLSSRIEDLCTSLKIKLNNTKDNKLKEISNVNWKDINYQLDKKRKKSLTYINKVINNN